MVGQGSPFRKTRRNELLNGSVASHEPQGRVVSYLGREEFRSAIDGSQISGATLGQEEDAVEKSKHFRRRLVDGAHHGFPRGGQVLQDLHSTLVHVTDSCLAYNSVRIEGLSFITKSLVNG